MVDVVYVLRTLADRRLLIGSDGACVPLSEWRYAYKIVSSKEIVFGNGHPSRIPIGYAIPLEEE